MSLQRVSQLYEERPSPRATAPPAPVTIAALPAVVNLALYQGDDFYLDLTVTNPDGSAADLAGVIPSAQIKTAKGATSPLATFDATVDATLTNVVHLHLPHLEAAQLVAGPAFWDCQIADTQVTTLAAGTVTVTGEVTT